MKRLSIINKVEVIATFSLNNSGVAYLIHGQYFRLDYKISNCLFCIFFYDNGESFFKRISVKRKSGVFENITNAYKPHLKIIAIGFGVKSFRFSFNINFVNAKPPRIDIIPLLTPSVKQLQTKIKFPQFHLPYYKKNYPVGLNVNSISMTVNHHDDLEESINNHKITKL